MKRSLFVLIILALLAPAVSEAGVVRFTAKKLDKCPIVHTVDHSVAKAAKATGKAAAKTAKAVATVAVKASLGAF